MSTSRFACRFAIVPLLLLAPALAPAQNGLSLSSADASWLRNGERTLSLRAGDLRLDLAVTGLGASQQGARLFGGWYMTGPGFGDGSVTGGLRLTTGLVVGPRSASWALPPGPGGDGLRLGPRAQDLPRADRDGERVALPYVGIGYTSLSLREGWGFSADIGLGGLRPGERVRLGGSALSLQVQSVLNDLRLAPVLQLGVSYAF